NSKDYKEYYACATGEATPKPKASARKKKGDSASSTTPPTPTPTTTVVSAPRLSATAKEEELAKNDDEDTETGKGGDEVNESEGESDDEETRQEEEGSFDLILRTPEGSEDESDDEEDQELRLGEEARIQEEEEADELYFDVNINQGRGLQVTQNIEDSHVTLTPVQPDGPQESSSMSSFMTNERMMIRKDPPPDQTKGLKDKKKEVSMHQLAFHLKQQPGESAFAEEPVQTTCQMEELPHPVFETGADDQPIVQTSQHPEWFSQPRRPPSPDRDWNKTLPAAQGYAQLWITNLARQTDPLPLIPDNRGRRVIPFDHFINNDLEYFRGGNGEEDLGLNIGEEERHIEEEDEDELYRDVNINQGRGLQASPEVEDSHVTLTPVNPDGQRQSSSVSSQFVISMLNSILDVGLESIFETTSQLDVPNPTFVAPLPITASKMTPSTIATITTTNQALILPTTVPSTIL
nr:hypothetical protein [Tanacetum cinerariifolium]